MCSCGIDILASTMRLVSGFRVEGFSVTSGTCCEAPEAAEDPSLNPLVGGEVGGGVLGGVQSSPGGESRPNLQRCELRWSSHSTYTALRQARQYVVGRETQLLDADSSTLRTSSIPCFGHVQWSGQHDAWACRPQPEAGSG